MKVEVKSSNIVSIDYDEKEQSLIVEFPGNSRYKYEQMPIREYKDFLNAESKGKYFHKHIRSNYVGEKIEKENQCVGCINNIGNFCSLFDRVVDNYSSCEQFTMKPRKCSKAYYNKIGEKNG